MWPEANILQAVHEKDVVNPLELHFIPVNPEPPSAVAENSCAGCLGDPLKRETCWCLPWSPDLEVLRWGTRKPRQVCSWGRWYVLYRLVAYLAGGKLCNVFLEEVAACWELVFSEEPGEEFYSLGVWCVWGGVGGELVKILDFAARELDMMSRVFVRWVSWSIVLRS